MTLKHQLEHDFKHRQEWALRRQLGIPNNRRLWVCTCMDERLPIDDALGIRGDQGDAHVFRNAGGLITDDAIQSWHRDLNSDGEPSERMQHRKHHCQS